LQRGWLLPKALAIGSGAFVFLLFAGLLEVAGPGFEPGTP
jgi:hypothetical protein